jgi:hypothetical protein
MPLSHGRVPGLIGPRGHRLVVRHHAPQPVSRRTQILLVLAIVLAAGVAVALLRGGKAAPTTAGVVVLRPEIARAD